jgi:hypothetical protein
MKLTLHQLTLAQTFQIHAILQFALLCEIFTFVDPDSLKVPLKKFLELVNWKVTHCPCGFFKVRA